jgi:Tfp pilus assembly protein PilV
MVVLVSIGILAVLLVSILRLAAAERRALRAEQWRTQAAWLAESAVERAAARLEADSSYAGETWTIPPEELDGRDPASVSISVETSAGQPSRRVVRVVADYPSQFQDRVRRSRQVVLDLSQGETQR